MPDLQLALIKEVVRSLNEARVWGVNGGIEPEITSFTAPLAASLKSASREVKAAELLDRSFVERILVELGPV